MIKYHFVRVIYMHHELTSGSVCLLANNSTRMHHCGLNITFTTFTQH